MSSISRRIAVMTCSRPTGTAGRAGQRDVDGVARRAARRARARSSSARRASTAASSALRASLAARPTGAALLRRELRRRRAAGSAARPCGRGRRSAPPRARPCRRPPRSPPALAPAAPRSARSCARHPSRLRRAPIVAAIAALSDSERIGMWAVSSHAASTSARQPLALGADHQRHRPRRRARRAAGRRAPPARPCGRAAPPTSRHAHDRHGEDRAHRRAHRLGAVRVGGAGPERDAAGAERERRAQHRADVARVVDAPQRDAHRARRAPAPSAAGRPRARACPSRAGRPA